MDFLAPHIAPRKTGKQIDKGCPADCGYCPTHQQAMFLPVVPITSACNLNCPICYTINKNKDPYFMDRNEMRQILDQLLSSGREQDIINFTGGEPMLHPQIITFLQMCRDAGLRRLTVSTNGLTLTNESIVQELKAVDASIILSMDTFDPQTDLTLHRKPTMDAKLRAMDLLTKHEVTTTVLPAIAKNVNDKELPHLLETVLSRPNTVSLEVHTMCFTGQGGGDFSRTSRITIPDIHDIIDQATQGEIQSQDFVPSPLAHPQCYSICYLLMLDNDQGYVPFARLMGRDGLYNLLNESLYIEPRDKFEQTFLELIDTLWANPDLVPKSELVLATLKRMINALFPSDGPALSIDQRRHIAEKTVKAIYIHSHMDEDNFDTSRLMKCCVGVPYPDGTSIPTCAYNVLYRKRDTRFADPYTTAQMDRSRAKQNTSFEAGENDGSQ
jgi:hypothetical protein